MIALSPVDLSTAVIGTTGTIDVSQLGNTANPKNLQRPAVLYFHNDSGAGIQLAFKTSGGSVNLPAGAWAPIPLPPGESAVQYTVIYLIPSPPVTMLLISYFAPGEPIPPNFALGNSPVGGTTNMTTPINVVDDARAAGAITVESRAAGDLFSAYQQQNNGLVAIGNNNGRPGTLDIFGGSSAFLSNDGGASFAGNQVQIQGATGNMIGTILNLVGNLVMSMQGVSVNGSTSGTCTLYEWVQTVGGLKCVLIAYNNFRNGGAGTLNIALPTAFSLGFTLFAGNVHGADFLAGGVAVATNVITALAAGGGTPTAGTTVNGYSLATGPAWDTYRCTSGNATTKTGFSIIQGV